MCTRSESRPATSLRALIVALLLAGIGLWQAWTCTNGMMTSPLAATAMTVMMSGAEHAGHSHPPAAQDPADGHGDPGMPAGVAAMCVSVLASVAAVLMVLGSPLKLVGTARRLADVVALPVLWLVRAPVLVQLGVSRT